MTAPGMASPEPRSGAWMQTPSGGRFYPLDPRPEDFGIRDIAHALANINRFTGHTCRPYHRLEVIFV